VPKYYKNEKVEIHLNPCIKCGSTDILLWDCGYSSFNPGGGKCLGCGRKVKAILGCMVTDEDLSRVWNRDNDIDKSIRKIEEKLSGNQDHISKLLAEKARLESLRNK
jgi:hypothetical protein